MSDLYRIEHGDCLALLKREPANSWDAMVTDPPGGIGFMGREWDKDKGGRKKWCRFMAQRFKAALRVLKPGAHALVWALPKTSHWTGSALEDAGFEVRDGISHAFGSGFPKSHNLPEGLGTALKPAHELWFLVRKPLEKGLTIEQNFAKWGTGVLNIDGCRVSTGENPSAARRAYAPSGTGESAADSSARGAINYRGSAERYAERYAEERPSEEAGRWPPNLCLTHDSRCRRLGTRAVKANPTWDTPNRDTAPSAFTGSEVSKVRHSNGRDGEATADKNYADSGASSFAMKPGRRREAAEDVPVWDCVDGCPVRLLDAQSGERTSGFMAGGTARANGLGFNGAMPGQTARDTIGDSGTASRFFPQFEWSELDDLEPFIYAAKASRGERDKGLEHFKGNAAQRDTPNPGGIDAGSRNVHPTVKSVELIRYFVRLVTPRIDNVRPVVGDIFTGSGTGGVAALLEGCGFVGFELNDTDEEPFVSIARARCEHALGHVFIPRESLRAAEAPSQRSLFERTA